MSTRLSIAAIVPHYLAEPMPFTKPQAVRAIIGGRLSADTSRGKGRNAARRARALSRLHSLPLAQVRE